MTLDVDLDEPSLRALTERAAAEGMSAADLVRLLVVRYLAAPPANDQAWQDRWDQLLAEFRAGVPAGVTPEEIEADVIAARAEVRATRRARRH